MYKIYSNFDPSNKVCLFSNDLSRLFWLKIYAVLQNYVLYIVISIVIYFVGDALKNILKNRAQTIRMNLVEAEKRSAEARARLIIAEQHVEDAKEKALSIHENSLVTIELENKRSSDQAIEDIDRLYKVKEETILYQQQKIIKEIMHQVIDSAFEQVYHKLENKRDKVFQTSVTNYYINLFRNYKGD